MSQASPGAVDSSAYWDIEREFWQSEESLVWQIFLPNEYIITARVTMENGKLKLQIIELYLLLKILEFLRELQDNLKIGQYKLMIKKANYDSELVMCHCL
ncbi:hypothetical protein BDV27DRAFT_145240 [Aspergillus caelatus]|uniref:Uncharacterized protein n=1 Tax=Aspergillus caelatus TaxID=61420 RepID=A0A5N7A3S8_9EURO|nr:uncharacterized protein BDV27DRAFT_145240 [Aspergillus caelatus]KAE8364482.1 hypothetical protein BDV27DRAFT_145240 [Aspergillus caelatus]